jgi:hypothetical protein
MMMPSVPTADGDGAALAFQPVGLVAEVGGLDLDLVPIDRRLLRLRAADRTADAASAARMIRCMGCPSRFFQLHVHGVVRRREPDWVGRASMPPFR